MNKIDQLISEVKKLGNECDKQIKKDASNVEISTFHIKISELLKAFESLSEEDKKKKFDIFQQLTEQIKGWQIIWQKEIKEAQEKIEKANKNHESHKKYLETQLSGKQDE